MKNAGWHFDNSYETLPSRFFEKVELHPVANPQIVLLNRTIAEELGLDADELKHAAEIFAGHAMPAGAAQLAQAYAGHQFGYFNMLGDGRAMLLGEQITPTGKRFDIQLKGSGTTPYSRRGDGRAALGPMLREVIISEAMHGLGIPTTRSLAVAATGEPIYRETVLPGAVLTRVASSHIRVATFQYAAQFGTKEELQALADYTITRHYPYLRELGNPYLGLLDEVMERQAELVAKWQLVGFVHGVLNTDNVSICGETIDYGPCAFINQYDPATVFSSIDKKGRYAYGNQPQITLWNVTRFAESLLPLFAEEQDEAIEKAQQILQHFMGYYYSFWLAGMREKLGLLHQDPADGPFVESLLKIMQQYKADYTNTFRALADGKRPQNEFFQSAEFSEWEEQWMQCLTAQETTFEDVQPMMQAASPAVIARNHRVEEALTAANNGDMRPVYDLLQVLANPYSISMADLKYTELPNDEEPYITYCGT